MRDSRRAHPYARYIASLFERDGFVGVELESEVAKGLWNPVGASFVAFDVGFWAYAPLPHREYVECKYKSTGSVTPEDVAKFIADMLLCDIPRECGLVVTNRGYLPRPEEYARLGGVRLYVVPFGRTPSSNAWLDRPVALIRHIRDQMRSAPSLPREFVRIV